MKQLLALTLATALGGCLLNVGEPDRSFTADYQFALPQTNEGWTAGFADFPADREEDIEFIGEVRPRPETVGNVLPALYLRGMNISDDLFMYWFRKVDGFLPNTPYTLGFDVEYVSNFSRDCSVGTGAQTWIKAGAFNIAPERVLAQDGYYRMNVDKGNQAQDGATALNIGDIRNNRAGCSPSDAYGLWARHSGRDAIQITTNANGEMWLLIGTESGFESAHDIYFTRLGVRFKPVE